ncbi:MAG: cytochrome c oxidase subunit I [Crocinitomicaceae bacterium]|nr:cytochrome c oxidase subunit I [Crocinitomicaceae bacterium]
MFGVPAGNPETKTTSYKVVVPFYIYASLSFLVACVLLFTSKDVFLGHYFQPRILAITHTMALGWATMMILGASHQMVPVLIEGKLYSEKLAYVSFILAAIGIPLLVYSFYVFDMQAPAKWGGRLVVLSFLAYLINMAKSIMKGKSKNIHAVFVFTSVFWLLITTLFGLLLVYNFTTPLVNKDSIHYLTLHAHAGIVGWFLLLVIGIASRLIPMFLISKYTNAKLLWIIFYLINTAVLLYILIFYNDFGIKGIAFIPGVLVLFAVALFIYYCRQAYIQRLRKQIDEPMKISLLSVAMLLLPVLLLFIIIGLLYFTAGDKINLILGYGFLTFFGWLTAIILGMTFKTLPFIVWNKVYHHRAALGKTPSPRDMFNHPVIKVMGISYLAGFIFFVVGILASCIVLLNAGSILLILTAILYNWNVFKVINHKAVIQ